MRPVKNIDNFTPGKKIYSSQTREYYGEIVRVIPCNSSSRHMGEAGCNGCITNFRWLVILPTYALEKAWGHFLEREPDLTVLWCHKCLPPHIIE